MTSIIDQYIAATIINKDQQRTAKKIIKQVAAANMSVMLREIRKRFGSWHEYVVREVLIYDWDCQADEYSLSCLREALDFVAESRLKGDPLCAIRKTAERVGAAKT